MPFLTLGAAHRRLVRRRLYCLEPGPGFGLGASPCAGELVGSRGQRLHERLLDRVLRVDLVAADRERLEH